MKLLFFLYFKYIHTHMPAHQSCHKMCLTWDRAEKLESPLSKTAAFNLLLPHGLRDAQPSCIMHDHG